LYPIRRLFENGRSETDHMIDWEAIWKSLPNLKNLYLRKAGKHV